MGRIVYFTGMTVSGRQDLLIRELAGLKYPPFLYLLSTRGKVIEYEGDPRFWLKGWVDTLSGFIHRIFESCIRYEGFGTVDHIDEGLRILIIKKIIQDRAGQPDGLSYLSTLLSTQNREQDFPGIYRSIAGFFSLLIRNNQQDRLADALGKLISETGQYALESDLVWLFGDYEELKRQTGVYDDDDILRSVRDYLQGDEIPACLAGREIIILDNPVYFSKIEEDILEGLFRRVKEVWWLMDDHSSLPAGVCEDSGPDSGQVKEDLSAEAVFPEEDRNYEAFRLLKPIYGFLNRLRKQGFEQKIKKAENESLAHPLAASLFLDNRPTAGKNRTIQFRSFPERVSEVRAIASEIKKINYENRLDNNGGLGRIRVIFPRLQDYASIIFEIFPEYGIPFSLTRGLPLSAHPLSDLFLNIIKIPINQFNREDVFQLFTRGYMAGALSVSHCPKYGAGRAWAMRYPLFKDDLDRLHLYSGSPGEDQKGSLRDDIFILDRVCRRGGINRLNNLAADREEEDILRVREIYRRTILDERFSSERESLKKEYYRFLTIIDPLKDLLKPLAGLSRQSEPLDLAESFFSLLRHFHFPDIILDPDIYSGPADPQEPTRVVKRDVKVFNLLKGLVSAGSRELALAKNLFGLESPQDLLSEFYSVFRTRLRFSHLYDERNPNVVRISEWLEIRGRSFDYIFAGGLTADKFPLKEEKNFLFSASNYRPFRQIDPVEQSKYLFSHLLRNYRNRLYLSCPRYIDEKEVQPTPILFDIKSLVTPDAGGDDDLRGMEEVFKWDENPYYSSENELYNFQGEHGDSPAADMGCNLQGRIVVKRESRREGITRGINLLLSRMAEDGLFEYDGQIGKAGRFQNFLDKKPDTFSPSQLELLANCPMRYLFERLYRLQSMEEPGEELTPREMGTHIHAILNRLFDRLKGLGANVNALGLARTFALAWRIGEDYFERCLLPEQVTYLEYQKNELLLGLDKDPSSPDKIPAEREGVLARLLRFECEALKERLPRELEYAFGDKEGALVSFGRTFIKGFIDRFDIDKSDSECVYVYDYKTGRIPGLERVKKGLSFQLPAYMAALKQLHNFRKITAAFYSIRIDKLSEEDPFVQVLRERMEGGKGLDLSGVQVIGGFIDRLIDLVEQGSFHCSTDELQCEFCDFRYTCYVDGRRMNSLVNKEIDQPLYSGKRNLEQWVAIDTFRKSLKDVHRSMEKAFSLKTEQGRRKHAEAVMAFSQWLQENREKLPFSREYIDDIFRQLEYFKKSVFVHKRS